MRPLSNEPERALLGVETTSAGSAPVGFVCVISIDPTGAGVTSAYDRSTGLEALRLTDLTSAYTIAAVVPDDERYDGRQVLANLRRRSGLSWEQLAAVFGVSRRSVHFWASGKPMAAANEEKLHRVHAVVVSCGRSTSDETRAALLTPDERGLTPLDLLTDGRFDEATAALGARTRRAPPLRAPLVDARRPPPPADLVDARHDRVHEEVGRGRAARSVKAKSRGRS